MKNLLLFILLPALAFGQDSLFWNSISTHFGIGEMTLGNYEVAEAIPYTGSVVSPSICGSTLFNPRPTCEYWEKISDWKAENEGSAHCLHEWVMAAHSEVNDISLYLVDDLVYRPCGRDGRENFARICARCLRHETCTKTWGWDAVIPKKSEYQKLVEKIQRK